jgi:hypothetical protein
MVEFGRTENLLDVLTLCCPSRNMKFWDFVDWV